MKSFYKKLGVISALCVLLIWAIWPAASMAAEPPDMQWDKTFRGVDSTNEKANSVRQTDDGGYILVGWTGDCNPAVSDSCIDIYVVKTDSGGNKEWDKTFGGEAGDSGNSVIQTSDGGYLIAGYTKSYGAGSSDIWLIKIDSSGNKEWDKTFGGTDADGVGSVIQTSDGGYLIAGSTRSYGAGGSDAWLIKTDSTGNKEWDKTLGGSGDESANEVIESSNGGYIIVGQHGRDAWITKTDATGNQEWKKIFDYGNTSNTSCSFHSVQQTVDGGYIVAGAAYDAGQTLTNATDVWLIKTDSLGNTEWDMLLDGGNYETGVFVDQTSDGGYIVMCDANLRIWVVKTNSAGSIEWSEFFKKNDCQSGCSSGYLANDGGYVVGGWTYLSHAYYECWLFKLGGEPGHGNFFTLSGQEFAEVDFGTLDSEMGDVDGDGDLDVVFSGVNGSACARVYLNDGSGNFTDSGQAIGSGYAHDLLLRDFDNDGDLDIVLCVDNNLKLYRNNGSGMFTDSGQSLATNNGYMLAAGDLDNDGDVDFVAARESNEYAHFYLNDGQGIFSDGGDIPTYYCHEPAIGDVDGDGDLDVGFAVNWYSTRVFFNDGNADFPDSSSMSGGYPTQGGVYFADLDGDGDLDLFEGNYSGYSSKIFWNEGSGSFTDSGQTFETIDTTKVCVGDIDNDGDPDIASSTCNPAGEPIYLNDGAGQFSNGNDRCFLGSHVSLGDVDNDGDLDAISGKWEGGNALYLNNAAVTTANTAPGQPTGLQAIRDGEAITFIWEAGSDTETPAELLTYSLRVGDTEGVNEILSGVMPAGPGNVGHRLSWTLKGLPADSYYWSVQTVDSAFTSSLCSSAQFGNTKPYAPILIDIGDITENEPTFDWENVTGAGYYTVQYADNSDFSGSITVENIAPSDYTVTSPFDDGLWYWRVKAVDAAGNASGWSTGTFTVDTSSYCSYNPEKPVLLYPANGAVNVSRTPTLTASSFIDPHSCSTHWKTRWQISKHENFHGLTLNANTFDNLTTFEIVKTMLEPNTIYYWRVRYWGTYGNKSEWSNVYSFTTEAAVNDTNDNGIPDDQEVADNLDIDGDGTPDNNQADEIKSIKAKKGNNEFGIRPQDSRITRAEGVDADALSRDDNKPAQIPYGLVSFRLEALNYGDTTTVKIHLSNPAASNTKWMIYDHVYGWQDYSDHAVFNVERDALTIEIKDGGRGDGDHTENGVIVNLGGATLVIAGDTDDSGTIDLRDAILDLQILAGLTPEGVNKEADVNGDGNLGLEEIIYVLQILSET